MTNQLPIDPQPSVMPSVVATILRSVLVTLGGALVTKGYVTSETLSSVVGAVLVILPAVWGVIQKVQANAKLKAAIASPAVKS